LTTKDAQLHYPRVRKGIYAQQDKLHKLVFELQTKEEQVQELEHYVNRIHDPDDELYGRHLSHKEIVNMLGNHEAEQEVLEFLQYYNTTGGIQVSKHSYEYIIAFADIRTWEKMFSTRFHSFELLSMQSSRSLGVFVHRAEAYTMSNNLNQHISAIYNLLEFPAEILTKPDKRFSNNETSFRKSNHMYTMAAGVVTPSLLRNYYQINASIVGNSLTSQAIYGNNNEYLSTTDLTTFQLRNGLQAQGTSSNIGGFVATNGCDLGSCMEANLGKILTDLSTYCLSEEFISGSFYRCPIYNGYSSTYSDIILFLEWNC
jgi:subtilase family serine protease